MTMYNFYSVGDGAYTVEAINPSGLISAPSGKPQGERSFKVPSKHAHTFALRMMGKYRGDGVTEDYSYPVMPIHWPIRNPASSTEYETYFDLRAVGFKIDPLDEACFNLMNVDTGNPRVIQDPASAVTLERYWFPTPSGGDPDENPGNLSESCECYSKVTIFYEESPCDCWRDVEDVLSPDYYWAELLENTCVSVEKNASYELYTLPNRNLVWKDLPAGPDRLLKGDSYAYKIIPKADITVNWHYVPVSALCEIQAHLAEYRGYVNEELWGKFLSCEFETFSDSGSDSGSACDYEPETLLFVDYDEDRSKRTQGYIGMNTTTLKLHFKQKRVIVTPAADPLPAEVVGWNHLFCDRGKGDTTFSEWQRVVVEIGGGSQTDLFPIRPFANLLKPTLP
jgi:hypothetical protein